MLVNRPIAFLGPFSKDNVQPLIELSLISISCYELFPVYDLKKNIIPGLNLMVIFKDVNTFCNKLPLHLQLKYFLFFFYFFLLQKI